MALFQRQPINLTQPIPYTVAMATKTVLVTGLGNIGTQYNGTRHNVGFAAIDAFAAKNEFSAWQTNKKFKGLVAEKTLGSTRVILLKPATYMNASGVAVQAVTSFYKITPPSVVVVHDELSINFGQIRSRIGGQAAGNNGIKSIINTVGDAFGRVRIGIKNELADKKDASDFVLAKFGKTEQALLPDIYNEVNTILIEYIYGGELPHDTRTIN